MPEDQLTVLPPEVRQMVMTGTTAMMNGAGNPAMMGQGMMMDMGMMGPMGMGMNGDMGMNGPMMQVDGRGMMAMQDGGQGQVGNGGNGTPEQHGGAGMMQEGFVGNPAMMGMGMEYSAQVSCSPSRGLHSFERLLAGAKPDGAAADVPADGGPTGIPSHWAHRPWWRRRRAVSGARLARCTRLPGQRARAGRIRG